MSRGYNRKKKDKRAERTLEQKALDRRINRGELPRWSLLWGFTQKPDSVPIPKQLRWRQRDTRQLLRETPEERMKAAKRAAARG